MPYKCPHDGCNSQLLPDKSKTEKIGKVAITLYRCENCGLDLYIGTNKVIYKDNEPWGTIGTTGRPNLGHTSSSS